MKFPFCGRPSWAFSYVSATLSGGNFSNFWVISYSHLWFYWYRQTVSNMAVSIYTFLPSYLTNSWYRHTFRFCKPGGYEIVPHRKFNLPSVATKQIEQLFVHHWVCCRVSSLCFLFCLLIHVFFTCSFFKWNAFLFLIDLWEVFMYCG